MLHTKFRGNRPTGPEKIFEGFCTAVVQASDSMTASM